MTEAEESRLLRELERHGWQRTEVQQRMHPENYPPEYQAEMAVWVIESIWPPRNLRARVEFWRYPPRWYGPQFALRVNVEPADSQVEPPLVIEDLNTPHLIETLTEWRSRHGVASAPANDWLAGRDVRTMVDMVSKRVSERKIRLYFCAICRDLPYFLDDTNNRAAIETEEQYADGEINKREMRKVRKAVSIPWLTSWEALDQAQQAIATFLRWTPQTSHGTPARLLCEVLWDPWKPVPAIKPSWFLWNERTVARMAQAIYEEGHFDELAILADALEDAGCAERVILDHLRAPGPHVRGCWAVDALLGK